MATITDNQKVDRQDVRTINEFINFKNSTYSITDNGYYIPAGRYSTYDVGYRVNNQPFIIELKERTQHYYGTFLIDVKKIIDLKNIRNCNRRLIVMEPLQSSIYVFNIDKIDWENVHHEWRWLYQSDLRDENEQSQTKVYKEVYLLDWKLSDYFCFNFSSDTIYECKENLRKNQERKKQQCKYNLKYNQNYYTLNTDISLP